MNIIDHGTWETYAPTELPKEAPSGALFARRVGDDQLTDWYDYAKSEAFKPDSVKLTLYGKTVGAASTDVTRLWPGHGARVLELVDVTYEDAQARFGGKLFDDASQEFFAQPLEPRPDPLDELRARIQALEAKV